MKKYKNIMQKSTFALLIVLLGMISCEDFLDRPTEDNYTVDSFYKTDEQCFQAVNPVYNSPWYDFQRGFFKVGEVLAGNYYWGNSPYLTFTINSTDEDLVNMSASLWSVNAYCNGILENIDLKSGPNVTEITKNTVKGEALVLKAMAYFYLVRIYGAVPIIHNNSAMISEGGYNEVYRATIPNIYDYIIMTLEKAIEWLPEKNKPGRIDKYSAYGLLSKVYLTKSGYGMTGSRNEEDLNKAAVNAEKVIYQSGRTLLPKYSDIFRLENNFNEESLIAWHWVVSNQWTSQNTLQSDLGIVGFDEYGANWGGYTGPSVDLQEAFGENALSLTRNYVDARRKATMMMYGDKYEYFWVDKGGFDYTEFAVESMEYQSATGANEVKHLVGNNNDHVIGIGTNMDRMQTSLSTHLLRLADVYLIYAEAILGNNSSTSDAKALKAFNDVRGRSLQGYQPRTSITWNDIWKERRLELACEGDRWYDYVRWHYYNPQGAITEIKNQKRSSYSGLKDYYETGVLDPEVTKYDENPSIPNITDEHFHLPFPDTDLTMNPNLLKDPVEFDLSTISY
ncbi:MAG: RagB/SusD family nutrient uptake outer membrane protein [Dysgonamonadaceae bacterium]|nr:RagB/SusD family nutrient uptake outer membrane protein [Dysgonamonadaceae bacterium]MDD3355353.1 RagB/SusD family nutrient uptake outer membrane protein [Dysgonamonadaceae bacterium]MDD3726708.1 RagB/SusD family nutrient uptake outer membrane protein [Dysgonamonadaceae bacterium]MDD4246041.1 RagB/SusD family nutrient uptake outer membrane protein [Dysgonamonadaceae bacterium]MDD4604952.1 RagB/SusD family nutrient uptake outer membrane protein [Dysgonamonadaceae bacterium]